MNREDGPAIGMSQRARRHRPASQNRALRRLSCVLLLAQLGGAVSCGSDTTQPGSATPPVETILDSGQTISARVTPADTARYVVTTRIGAQFVVALEVDSGAAALGLYRDISKPPVQTVSAPADARHTPAWTSTLSLKGGEAYHVQIVGRAAFRVTALSGGDYPEHAPVVLTPGDTVTGESIDEFTAHDADEFLIVGKPGDEYDVFLQALTSGATQVIQLEVPDGVGSDLATEGNALDSSLTEHATGHFTLPANGMVHPRVSGKADANGNTSAGPYRLLAYQVHRAPEHSPVTFTTGDSVLTEAIDYPGDVDEFSLAVPNQVFINLLIACTQSVSDMRADIFGSNGKPIVTSLYCGPPTGLQGASGACCSRQAHTCCASALTMRTVAATRAHTSCTCGRSTTRQSTTRWTSLSEIRSRTSPSPRWGTRTNSSFMADAATTSTSASRAWIRDGPR